jgi:glutamine synthetase
MSSQPARHQAIVNITNYDLDTIGRIDLDESVEEIYASNVFSIELMEKRLPKPVFKALKKTIETGAALDPSVADVVAAAMKEWALENGATHYAHVFYPLTGLTAEKHDSFYAPNGPSNTIAEFSGKSLIQGEPDASSFPSGGIRATFEARGYTVWDVTSPAFLYENPNGLTLCIPTAFVSWTGEALDKKTPVLRSMQALNKQAQRVLKLFGHQNISMVSSTAGPEQEYFLIDKNFFMLRPDLINAGRTLFGAPPPKGQEFADQYFGAIPERVLAFMHECEREMFKLGIPIKTRHNEVAPSQYETAPIFEFANIAADHNQMVMHILKRTADHYGLACLLHEKPFLRLNGSGKHLNWSLGNSTQGNLLDPGDTPHANAQFLVFCAAVIKAVHKHQGLLRAVVATAHNDHRLGANEAPPAIISIFLGDQLRDVFAQLKSGGATTSKAKGYMTVGVDVLPPIPKDAGDRNRTSPFAFTGNKFEFRAVGASQSIAGPLVALNTIMAEALDEIATELEKATGGDPSKLNGAVQKLLQKIATECEPVLFEGDGYSEAWHQEAAKRGLKNLRTTPDALPELITKDVISLFEKYNVLSERELRSRYDIYVEQYCLNVNVEANLTLEMAKTLILPACLRYAGELAGVAANLAAAGVEKPDTRLLKRVNELTAKLQDAIDALEKIHHPGGGHGTTYDLNEAKRLCTQVIPAMLAVRTVADELETIVADDYWPLPTYQEMLFIK